MAIERDPSDIAGLRGDIAQLTAMRDEAKARYDGVRQQKAQALLDEAHAALSRHNLSLTAIGRSILAAEEKAQADPETQKKAELAGTLSQSMRRALAATETGRRVLWDKYGIRA